MVTPLQLLLASVTIIVTLAGLLISVVIMSSRGLEGRLGGKIDALSARVNGIDVRLGDAIVDIRRIRDDLYVIPSPPRRSAPKPAAS